MPTFAPNRKESEEYFAPDPRDEESLRNMLWRQKCQRAAHANMRVRRRDGTIFTPEHTPERCPDCKRESLALWDGQKRQLDRAATEWLTRGTAQAVEAPGLTET